MQRLGEDAGNACASVVGNLGSRGLLNVDRNPGASAFSVTLSCFGPRNILFLNLF